MISVVIHYNPIPPPTSRSNQEREENFIFWCSSCVLCLFPSNFEYRIVTELYAGHCLQVLVMPYAFGDAVSISHFNSHCGSEVTERGLLTDKNGAVG